MSSSESTPAPEPAANVVDGEYSRPVSEGILIDREQSVRIVVLDKPVENNYTEKDLRVWSLGFSRPTGEQNSVT